MEEISKTRKPGRGSKVEHGEVLQSAWNKEERRDNRVGIKGEEEDRGERIEAYCQGVGRDRRRGRPWNNGGIAGIS